MKKYIVLFIFFEVVSVCYSQDNLGRYINDCVSYISKPVPKGFSRGDRTTYLNEDRSIILKVIDGIVLGAAIGTTFDRTNEALEWQTQFYDYFEDNNWVYSNLSERGIEIYVKNKIYALIISPSKREDNQIVAMILFVDDLNNLNYIY